MNVLIEKYRPRTFDEVIGIKDKEKLIEIIKDPMSMPNILLYGSQGIGKTTCAKIMLQELKPIDVLRVNGSDTTGVDTIRDKVFNFMTSMSSAKNKPKIIWIEEFDFMSVNAYAALRSMMEQFIKNARFICTANYLVKIPEPIQSRFTLFEFTISRDFQEIESRLKFICEKEGITYNDENILIDIINKSRGDIRSCINTIQKLSSNPEKKIKDIENMNLLLDEVYGLILSGNWSKLRYELPNKYPDYNKLLVDLDEKFFNSELSITKKADVNNIIANGQMEMSLSFDKNICFAAICSRIIRSLKNE